MHTVLGRCCQTLRTLVFGCLWVLAGRFDAAGAEPTPASPDWQREINTARLLEVSTALTPAKNAEEQETRHVRLQERYRQLARKYPDNAAALNAAGAYFARDGQPAVALPLWEKTVALDPHDAAAASSLGGLYLQLGRTRDAYGQFQRAVDAQPDVSSYQSDLANVLYLFRHDLMSPPIPGLPDDQAALTQALAHFRRAAELIPDDARLAQAYAETFYIFARPDWAQALAAWETVLALSGEKTDFANSHLARISLRLGQPEAAAGYLARIHDPSYDGLKTKLLQQVEHQRQAVRHP